MAERLSGGTGRRRVDNTVRALLLEEHRRVVGPQSRCISLAGRRAITSKHLWLVSRSWCPRPGLMCALLHAGLPFDDTRSATATGASSSCWTKTARCPNGLSRKTITASASRRKCPYADPVPVRRRSAGPRFIGTDFWWLIIATAVAGLAWLVVRWYRAARAQNTANIRWLRSPLPRRPRGLVAAVESLRRSNRCRAIDRRR